MCAFIPTAVGETDLLKSELLTHAVGIVVEYLSPLLSVFDPMELVALLERIVVERYFEAPSDLFELGDISYMLGSIVTYLTTRPEGNLPSQLVKNTLDHLSRHKPLRAGSPFG